MARGLLYFLLKHINQPKTRMSVHPSASSLALEDNTTCGINPWEDEGGRQRQSIPPHHRAPGWLPESTTRAGIGGLHELLRAQTWGAWAMQPLTLQELEGQHDTAQTVARPIQPRPRCPAGHPEGSHGCLSASESLYLMLTWVHSSKAAKPINPCFFKAPGPLHWLPPPASAPVFQPEQNSHGVNRVMKKQALDQREETSTEAQQRAGCVVSWLSCILPLQQALL